MGKPYSMDLRERVVAAVDKGGLSCHRAAAQFGVGVNTAILWVRRFRATGSVAPGQLGGPKPEATQGDARGWLMERAKTDFTLRGLVAELAERGLKVDYRSVWEFVHAENLSFKKKRRRQRTRPSCRRPPACTMAEVSGSDRSRTPGLHRRDLDQNQHGNLAGLGAVRHQAHSQGSARPLEDHDLPGRFAPRSDRSAMGSRWPDRR